MRAGLSGVRVDLLRCVDTLMSVALTVSRVRPDVRPDERVVKVLEDVVNALDYIRRHHSDISGGWQREEATQAAERLLAELQKRASGDGI